MVTDLVSLVGPWKLPVMRLLAQVVKVAVGELRPFSGNLHGEARRDAVGALLVDQSESLEVPWRKHGGDLQAHARKRNYPTQPERSSVKPSFHLWNIVFDLKRQPRCVNVRLSYQVSVVGGAEALLGDAHAETGQAAVFVLRAQVEVPGLAAGAGRTFDVHLKHSARK